MRLPSLGLSLSLAAGAALLLTLGLSTAGAAPRSSQTIGTPPLVRGFGRVQTLRDAPVAPGLVGRIAAQHPALGLGGYSWVRPGVIPACFYLSDNSSGVVTIYSAYAPFPQIGALTHAAGTSYGWGVADTGPHEDAPNARNEAFVAAANDTIDVYDACKGAKVLRTLTGSGNGGAPYGIWAGDDGSVIATNFPNNVIDIWGPLPAEQHLGAVPVPKMGRPYFVFWDNNDAGTPISNAYLLVSGYDVKLANEQVDYCKLSLAPLALKCKTLFTIAGGFPGGVVGLEISGTHPNKQLKTNIIINNQMGTLSAYGCDLPTDTCRDNGDFIYNNGQSQVDYTAIDLAIFPTQNANNLGAANAYYCTPNKSTVCGDAVSQTLPIGQGTVVNGTSAQLGPPSIPVGFKIWPPYKNT